MNETNVKTFGGEGDLIWACFAATGSARCPGNHWVVHECLCIENYPPPTAKDWLKLGLTILQWSHAYRQIYCRRVNEKGRESTCSNDTVKVQASIWLKCYGVTLIMLYINKHLQTGINWSSINKSGLKSSTPMSEPHTIKQKMIASSYCSQRWFFQLLNHGMYSVFHTLLLHFICIFC